MDTHHLEAVRQDGPLPEDPELHDRYLADRLVAGGLLTRFQADELLAGHRRFHLGQYTVLDKIGRGGMAGVFKAKHSMMGHEVAIKVLARSKATPERVDAFQGEMRMHARLQHENILRATDAGYDAGVFYLVTEFVQGIDLRNYVKEHGPLDEKKAASIFSQASRGLAYAHTQGLIHRDVKPANILLMPSGRVKVLDLGLAESGRTGEATRLGRGRIVGTMDFIAPEQISDPDGVGPAADIYSLGCSLYFVLTGRVPFQGGTAKEKRRRHVSETPAPIHRYAPDVPPSLCRLVEEMMAKSPADRPGSALAVIERLRPWLPATNALIPLPLAVHQPRRPDEPVGQSSQETLRAVESTDTASGASDIMQWIDHSGVRDARRFISRVALIAVAGGFVGFLVMTAIRLANTERFDALLRVPPSAFGLLVSMVLFASQMLAAAADRRRN